VQPIKLSHRKIHHKPRSSQRPANCRCSVGADRSTTDRRRRVVLIEAKGTFPAMNLAWDRSFRRQRGDIRARNLFTRSTPGSTLPADCRTRTQEPICRP
jgi:hypothetical protein